MSVNLSQLSYKPIHDIDLSDEEGPREVVSELCVVEEPLIPLSYEDSEHIRKIGKLVSKISNCYVYYFEIAESVEKKDRNKEMFGIIKNAEKQIFEILNKDGIDYSRSELASVWLKALQATNQWQDTYNCDKESQETKPKLIGFNDKSLTYLPFRLPHLSHLFSSFPECLLIYNQIKEIDEKNRKMIFEFLDKNIKCSFVLIQDIDSLIRFLTVILTNEEIMDLVKSCQKISPYKITIDFKIATADRMQFNLLNLSEI